MEQKYTSSEDYSNQLIKTTKELSSHESNISKNTNLNHQIKKDSDISYNLSKEYKDIFSKLINKLEPDIISTIYGPSGCGKTLSCMSLCLNVISKGGKVIYIDTEGGFSIERFKQIAGNDFEKYLEKIIFLKPTTFNEQKIIIESLKDNITDHHKHIKLIIVDSIAMLYRLELGKNNEVYESNRELGSQVLNLSKISRTMNIPIVITNQVYSNMDKGVKMVGGDSLIYMSKCLIELKKGHEGIRKAILKRHRSIQENKEITFKIIQSGFDFLSYK